MNHLFGSTLVLLSLFFTTAVQASSEIIEDQGYVLEDSLWDKLNIPVCWENPNAAPEEELAWVRNAVEKSWEAKSQVSFTGWGTCNTASDGIRILINDQGPHVKALGNGLDGFTNGMVLNFTYLNWSPSCGYRRQYCSEVIAVHEFGHALGFAHEQNRNDTPDTCTNDPQGTDGDIRVGEWDLYSVMNYCNPDWNGNGRLSDTDIITVQQFYGVPENEITLAEVCSVEASSNDGNGPGNTLDGDLDTRWSASGNGEWIEYTLCETNDVQEVDISWYKGDERYSIFAIEAGDDRNSLTTVFSGNSSGESDGYETYSAFSNESNVVRITGYGNSLNTWNSINEVEIFGKVPTLEATLITPAGFDLNTNGTNAITLSWSDLSTNEQGYTVERLNSSGDYEIIALTGADADEFIQTGLSIGTTYSYRISAFYQEQRSGYAYAELTIEDTASVITPISASDFENDGNGPENAIDGDFETRWSSEGIQMIEIALGDVYTLTSLAIAWYKGDERSSSFNISVSTDGQWWTAPVAFTSSGSTEGLEAAAGFSNVDASIVRITGFGNSANDWNSILEVEFKGY